MNHPIFGDAQKIIRAALLPRIPPVLGRDVRIVTKTPNPRDTEFLLLLLSGGERKNLITVSPRIIFEAWSTSSTAAAGLAQATYAVVHSLAGQYLEGVQFGTVEDVGLLDDLPDPDSAQARYTFSSQLDMSYIDTF